MVSEIQRIAEQSRRYSAQMVERMAEAKAQRESRSREYSERMAAEAQQYWQEFAEQKAQDEAHIAGATPEYPSNPEHSNSANQTGYQRVGEGELLRNRPDDPPVPRSQNFPQAHRTQPERDAESVGELDPRRAIARSMAARRRNDVVVPVDDDGDDEGEYYRRNSWLV